MNAENKRRIIAALENAVQQMGAQNWQEGMGSVTKLFEYFLVHLRQMDTPEAVAKLLDSFHLTPEEELTAVEYAEGALGFIRHYVDKFSKEIKEDLPAASIGRRKSLSTGEAREAVALILQLFGSDIPLSIAKRQVAKRFGVSVRTVQRAWSSRSELMK